MTVSKARVALAQEGIQLTSTQFGEYRVNQRGASESTAYYTDDIDDAYQTGLAMANDRRNRADH